MLEGTELVSKYMCRAAMVIALSAMPLPASADVTIGYLAMMTGASADLAGESALHAVRMAVDEFGGKVNGEPIKVLSADHLGKADVGMAIAREWIDQKGVNLLLNVDNSAAALAVSDLIRDKNVSMMMAAANAKLINEKCGPHQVMTILDTASQARAVVIPQVKAGGDKWFFITVDYALGHDLQARATEAITAAGGKVVGSALHSPQATDFSAFLLQAQASGATNIALATFGTWQNTIAKQAQEFGVKATLSPFYLTDTDVKSVGLATFQGVSGTIQFYWNQNDATRAFAKRYLGSYGRPPTWAAAGNYEYTRHYLRAVDAVGSTDADKIHAWMRQYPMELVDGSTATIRKDGFVVRDVYSFRTKAPAESTGDWDYFTVTGAVPGEQIAPDLSKSACPYVKS
jgi:branched-chain amino acid transport system substrate-binding protein